MSTLLYGIQTSPNWLKNMGVQEEAAFIRTSIEERNGSATPSRTSLFFRLVLLLENEVSVSTGTL
jgi:hypothetical protein